MMVKNASIEMRDTRHNNLLHNFEEETQAINWVRPFFPDKYVHKMQMHVLPLFLSTRLVLAEEQNYKLPLYWSSM